MDRVASRRFAFCAKVIGRSRICAATPQQRCRCRQTVYRHRDGGRCKVLSAGYASKLHHDPGQEQQSLMAKSMPSEKVVGFLGGGQLGRMAALAAANLGVKVRCLDPTPHAPASVAAEQVVGDFRNPNDILQFAESCDVLTVEIEHVDVDALRTVSDKLGIPVQPSPDTLETIQDKYRQKMHFKAHGIPMTESIEVADFDALSSICERGYPVMLKARRLAYDGRGNHVIQTVDDVERAVQVLGGFESGLYVEAWVPFVKELAVIVAKSVEGEIVSYPVTETIHRDSICFITETPAAIDPGLMAKAKNLAEDAVRSLDGGGVYGVEMFLLEDGTVLLNEIAPRPHNSGHYTIDACYTSQFEQHIRSILGWPLGDTSLMVGSAIMMNLLGEDEGIEGLRKAQSIMRQALKVPGAMVHWYEKPRVQKNRKIGHINIVGSTREETRNRLSKMNGEAFAALVQTQAGARHTDGLAAEVGVIMGSDSDLSTMKAAAEVLDTFGVPVEVTVVSAHRTPERMLNYAKNAHKRGLKVIIAGAGGAAHLPGMVAALTPLPVIGVPCVPSGSHLDGLDALMSIAQMPKGVPVATVAIGNAANAALLAVRILGVKDLALLEAMVEYQATMKNLVMEKAERLESKGWKQY